MARIRTIKPEFWADEKTATLSVAARLLLIGLFNFSDDEGRMRASPIFVRAQVFPYDSSLDVASLLGELASARRITLYEHEEQSYLHIVNFNKHQRIDHPTKSALPPPPPPDSRKPREPSRILASVPVGNGVEGTGMDLKTSPAKPEASVVSIAAKQKKPRPSTAKPGYHKVKAHFEQAFRSHANVDYIWGESADSIGCNWMLSRLGESVQRCCTYIDSAFSVAAKEKAAGNDFIWNNLSMRYLGSAAALNKIHLSMKSAGVGPPRSPPVPARYKTADEMNAELMAQAEAEMKAEEAKNGH